MRLWSIHPKYLDSKGLVALWREALLAKNVLANNTNGYKNHPQLIRFKNSENPLELINQYLLEIFQNSVERNYHFNKNKIDLNFVKRSIKVTKGQIDFEQKHLLEKLKKRNKLKYEQLMQETKIKVNPIFTVVPGCIELWEKI